MAKRKTSSSASKPLARTATPARRKRQPRTIIQSLPVRTILVVAGIAGLAALGVALLNSRRFQEDVVLPLGKAVAPQADRVWAETRPWRDSVSRLMSSINTQETRERIAERLTQWIDRFR